VRNQVQRRSLPDECADPLVRQPFGTLVEANALDRAAEHQLPRIGPVTGNEDVRTLAIYPLLATMMRERLIA
jgi:hypothetical protein